jgi:hypothetical protein
MRGLALVVGILALIGPGAYAKDAGLEVQPTIGGTPMRCYDFRGVVVRTLESTELGDVGRATVIARMPIIQLDPDRMATLPPKLQMFFYMHECAHHVLAHIIRPTLESEREADRWAVQYGKAAGLFTRSDVEGFAPYFAASKGSPFGHLPGPERSAFLLQAFDEPDTTIAAASR